MFSLYFLLVFTSFEFYPSDPTYLVAGLANGQIGIWRLSQADLTGYKISAVRGRVCFMTSQNAHIVRV